MGKETQYITFEITLSNGSKCQVRYRKCYISIPVLHKRVDHAVRIANALAGFTRNDRDVQLSLLDS